MKYWPLVKVLPVRTHFKFVSLAKYFGALSILLVIGSLAVTLVPFKPTCFGMACGIGNMPLALTATVFGFLLLPALDLADRHRRRLGRRRIRFGDVKDPRTLEPALRAVLERTAVIHGSRIAVKSDEVVVDVFGDKISSAGQVLDLLAAAGIKFDGDISVEDI